MREILFRGKLKDSNVWVEGDLQTVGHKRFIDGNRDRARVSPETVCQYTGLADKNGKKIFEGDILIGTIGSASENLGWRYKGIAVFKNGAFVIQNVFPFGFGETKDGFYQNIQTIGFGSFNNYEVIGNSYDQCKFLGDDDVCQKESDDENIVYCVMGPCPELLEEK